MVVDAEDTAGFHGSNERISIDNMVNATRFFHSLIKRGTSG
jgi:carboxypeptidase PM20D1